jgi:two-component system, OmpR family, response regulator
MPPRILVVDDNQELLALLTQLFEDAGYSPAAAGKGKAALELARAQKPELAVLDVLLPDMMGFALADALRKEFPSLPIVFLTGVFKGGKHALEAKNKHGAAGYFEKPFDAHKLLEALSKIVPPQKGPPAAASIEEAFDVELDIDVEEEEPLEPMELTGRIKVTGSGNLTAEIRGETLTTSVVPAPHVSPERLISKTPTIRTLSPGGEPPRSSRRGELKDNLPSLVNAFYLSKETGELGVQKGKVKKVVFFEKGTPVFALSNLATDRFGQFLVRVGKIKQEDLKDAAAVASASKRRTGDVLVERGLLKDTERLYYVGQQVKSIIYSLFGWEDGTYTMSFRDRVAAESIKLDIHPGNLIVRGVKKLYKPDRLKRLLKPEDRLIVSSEPSYPLKEIELERWEEELLLQMNGQRTVAELLAVAKRPEPVVMGTLCALLALKVVDPKD